MTHVMSLLKVVLHGTVDDTRNESLSNVVVRRTVDDTRNDTLSQHK